MRSRLGLHPVHLHGLSVDPSEKFTTCLGSVAVGRQVESKWEHLCDGDEVSIGCEQGRA